jgi:hypothetical protein
MSKMPKAEQPVAYSLDVVDDDLGEATSQDTERSQDGTKCVDPHEIDLSLRIEVQRTWKVGMCHQRNAEAATLRTYH